MRPTRVFLAIIASSVVVRGQATAQIAPGLSSTTLVVEQQVRDRWLHGRQQPRFSPFTFDRTRTFIDSTHGGRDERRLYLTLGRSASGRDSAVLVVSPTGRLVQLLHGGRFAQRLWDIVPTFPKGTPRVGLTWTDTIAYVASDDSLHQSLRGSRSSRITKDTVIAGRRLWLVRDSAIVEYEESYAERERTLDTTVQVSRTAAGMIRGGHLYDPDLRLFRSREDTTRLAGEAVLRYPDGRSFRTPARYERTRRSELFDSAAYSALQAERLAAAHRGEGGMVFVPANELERRLADGDATARDSILRAWRRASDPDEAEQLFELLDQWSARSKESSDSLEAIRIAAGDTAFFYRILGDRAYLRRGPTDVADMRAMLRFMEDPSIAWGFNLDRDWLYENLVQALTSWPRAGVVAADNASISCTVAACRLLGEQWSTSREPRLRDVGLVALLSVDPRRWADTVLALDGPRHPFLHSAAQLAKGAVLKAPMPPPNSDWRAWLDWMNGADPHYAEPLTARSLPQAPAIERVRFDESHRTAIRFYTARTGRDIVGELRRGYATAESDSVRFVFATMLEQLGPFELTEAEVADAFMSAAPARVALARLVLMTELNRTSARMSDVDAAPLLDRVVAAAVDGTPLWRAAVPDGRSSDLPGVHAVMNRIFLQADSVPDAVRQKWRGRVEIIAGSDWRRRDPRMGGVLYQLAPVRTWGRFARVYVTLSERISRRADEAPAENASGETYYLMRVNDEWVLVADEGWIT